MWTITIEAPNGLKSKLRIDQKLMELSRLGPTGHATSQFHNMFEQMWLRRDEKNPNEEANNAKRK